MWTMDHGLWTVDYGVWTMDYVRPPHPHPGSPKPRGNGRTPSQVRPGPSPPQPPPTTTAPLSPGGTKPAMLCFAASHGPKDMECLSNSLSNSLSILLFRRPEFLETKS